MEKFSEDFLFLRKILEKNSLKNNLKNFERRKIFMQSFLKKLESENFRLRFLNFSEIDSWSALDNYTRIKSFILDGEFELSCSKWYKMYISIVESLQKINPQNLEFLLNLSPFKGRCVPFLDYRGAGYELTNFGLYLRVPTAANDVIPAIKRMLRVYGFNSSDAYLIIELNPDSASYYSDDIIEQEQFELLSFLEKTFVKASEYYDMSVKAIEEMNGSLQQYTKTTYNNLYLLGESDYDRYSKEAIEWQLRNPTNSFSRRELTLAVNWLNYSRFFEDDYRNIKHKTHVGTSIKTDDKLIPVTFKTHFYSEEVVENE